MRNSPCGITVPFRANATINKFHILTTASSETLNPSPPLMDSRRSPLHPRKSAWGGDPEVPQFTPLNCARVPPPIPRWPRRVQMTVASSPALAFTSDLQVRRSHWSFRGCRVHSELKFVLILRPASWLALLSRTFTFELALTGSPQTNVEYDYVGKQSIPTTGLSPASPTALWAAEIGLTPRTPNRSDPEDPRSHLGRGPICRSEQRFSKKRYEGRVGYLLDLSDLMALCSV